MNLLALTEPTAGALATALELFERQFRYPLGVSGHFRIFHGAGYLPFFQAMGPATLWLAEWKGNVLGTLVSVPRCLEVNGGVESLNAHYICDLKIGPGPGRGRVLAALMSGVRTGIETSGGRAAFGIVMSGTEPQPGDYTGRLGIPRFESLGQILVLRISPGSGGWAKLCAALPGQPERPNVRVTGGFSSLRSLMEPVTLGFDGTGASATLEDTRRGKRLWLDDGTEMLSGHLSGFRFCDPKAGSRVIRQGLGLAVSAGLPAVFVSVPALAATPLLENLADLHVGVSPAEVYGCGLPCGMDWWVDTAEI